MQIKNCNFKTLLITLFTITSVSLSAQTEGLIKGAFNRNPVSKHVKRTTRANIVIPFLDDFAQYQNGFNTTLWDNSGAYINASYSNNPPNIGIVTFDAIDANGKVHTFASSNSFKSDRLTSKPINLNYAASDSVYLSFSYQPGGNGDQPEKTDSLIVEFYAPEKDEWKTVWAQEGIAREAYKTATIKIIQTDYLKDGFKFRFCNYASLTQSNADPNLKSNYDHWNIDFVYLDKNRTYKDTIFDDVAMIAKGKSMMVDYTNVPKNHLTDDTSLELFNNPMEIGIKYRNNSTIAYTTLRRFIIKDKGDPQNNTLSEGGWVRVDPGQEIDYTHKINYDFVRTLSQPSEFEIISYLHIFSNRRSSITVSDQKMLYNDTTKFTHKFEDYYSYDDGTAESGYGLLGNNIINGSVAMQFNAVVRDTISAINIFFNDVQSAPRTDRFKLMIWNDNGGAPGDIIYEGTQELEPKHGTSLNGFTSYKMDKQVIVKGKYYVGWKQMYENFMNVGFDVSNIQNKKLFFNVGNGWEQSKEQGVCMIRVEFDNIDITVTPPTDIKDNNNSSIKVYPNPTDGIVNVSADNLPDNEMLISVYNTLGIKVIEQQFYNQQQLDLTSLKQGLYFIRIFDHNNKIVGTTKIIKR
ncbi:MAG: T9SS type A sorting domain-containing protein [Bacteroidales bacterium]|jgi:hypothetical protein|nr:T9SS type A sorting domain-containing protein [Bacteroidales bacterium]